MSSIARTLPRLVRPVAVSARSFHQSARQLDNNPPPTHRAIIVDYDRVPTGFPNPDLKPTPGIMKLAWASVAFVFATWIYNGFAPKNNHWAGNLGYTDAELKEQKKKKESDNEGE